MAFKACTADSKDKKNEKLPILTVEFLVTGLLFLLVSLFSDPARYFKHLYTTNRNPDYMNDKKVSMESFNKLEAVVIELLDEIEAGKKSDKKFLFVDYVKFNKRLQHHFDLAGELSKILYGMGEDQMFVVDEFTGKKKLSQYCM